MKGVGRGWAIKVLYTLMKFKIKITIFLFAVFSSTVCRGQNIFDTTRRFSGLDIIDKMDSLKKFENFIKKEAYETLKSSDKLILFNLTGGMVPDFLDSAKYDTVIFDRFLIINYSDKKGWTAINYLKSFDQFNNEIILKSSPIKLFENSELFDIRNKWDSLGNDFYLPFVSEIEINGKKGYTPESASDMRFIYLYAIDKKRIVFKSIYENDLEKEWNIPNIGIHKKNINYAYNYSQPTFELITYLLPIVNSRTSFSNYKLQ